MIYCTASRALVNKICVPVLSCDTTSLRTGSTGLEKLFVLFLSDSQKLDLQDTEQPIGRYNLRRAFPFAVVTCSNATGQDFDCNRSTQIAKDRGCEGT